MSRQIKHFNGSSNLLRARHEIIILFRYIQVTATFETHDIRTYDVLGRETSGVSTRPERYPPVSAICVVIQHCYAREHKL